MNFTQAVSEVLELVNRPEKKVEAENAVNTVLSLAIYKASFVNDLVETTINAEPLQNAFSGVVDLTVHTNFRKLKYIRPTQLVGFLKPKQPQGVILGGQVLRDVYWISGTKLNWTSATATNTLEIGYYVYPPTLSDASPNHWFLEAAPYAIIDLAAARLFRRIGDDKSARDHEGSGSQIYLTIKSDLESKIEPEAV